MLVIIRKRHKLVYMYFGEYGNKSYEHYNMSLWTEFNTFLIFLYPFLKMDIYIYIYE